MNRAETPAAHKTGRKEDEFPAPYLFVYNETSYSAVAAMGDLGLA